MSRSRRNLPAHVVAMREGAEARHGCNGTDCTLSTTIRNRDDMDSPDGRCFWMFEPGPTGQRRFYFQQISDWGHRKTSLRRMRYEGKPKKLNTNRRSEELGTRARMRPYKD